MTRLLVFTPLALVALAALACGGGSQPTANLSLTADLSQLPAGADPNQALTDAAETLRNRAASYGIKDPQITLGGSTISLALKGIDQDSAVQLATQQGVLEFKREEITTDGIVVCQTPQGERFGVPPQAVNPDDRSHSLARCLSADKLGEPIWVAAEVEHETGAPTELTQDHVEPGGWELRNDNTAISVHFTPDGGDLLQQITSALKGYHLGLFLDGVLVAAPRIQRAVTDGNPLISGFSAPKARVIAAVLNSPPLAVTLTPSP